MFQFTLNGAHVSTDADKNLLEYLREDARLTSVKDGCDEGVCGSCSVIVNGKAVRACTHHAWPRCNGKSVITAEGLSAREREVYAMGLRRSGRRAVRILHARNGDQREGAARRESRAYGGRSQVGRFATISAAAPAT